MDIDNCDNLTRLVVLRVVVNGGEIDGGYNIFRDVVFRMSQFVNKLRISVSPRENYNFSPNTGDTYRRIYYYLKSVSSSLIRSRCILLQCILIYAVYINRAVNEKYLSPRFTPFEKRSLAFPSIVFQILRFLPSIFALNEVAKYTSRIVPCLVFYVNRSRRQREIICFNADETMTSERYIGL